MNRTKRNDKIHTPHKKSRAIISVFLVVAILIAGAYAFLSATDSKTNVFTVGNVDIELHEIFNGRDYGKGEDPGAIGDKIENIVPGQSIEKAPYVVNTGKNPAYTFIAVGIPTDTSDNVYNGQGTYTAKSELDIKVKAYAIQQQYNGATDAESTWANYFKKDMISGTASDAGIELFTLNDGTSAVTTGTHTIGSDWQEFSTPYSVTDGGNTYTYHFFKYVANNELLPVGTTTTHLFDKVILNENIGEIKPAEPPKIIETNGIVPEGCTYTPVSTKEDITSGNTIPSDVEVGDIFTDGEYEYHFSQYFEPLANNWVNMSGYSYGSNPEYAKFGWSCKALRTKTQEKYNAPYSQINGAPITIMSGTYLGCKKLIEAPQIPESVYDIRGIFEYCENLVDASDWVIPNTVELADSAFAYCTNLTKTPVFPDSITQAQGLFENCISLVTLSNPLPQNASDLSNAFAYCRSLIVAPKISNNVQNIQNMFQDCSSLTIAEIPITDCMYNVFTGCDLLTSFTLFASSTCNILNSFGACPNVTCIEYNGVKYTSISNLVSALNLDGIITYNSTFSLTGLSQ